MENGSKRIAVRCAGLQRQPWQTLKVVFLLLRIVEGKEVETANEY
jgi:hypothetical protein